MNSGRTQGVWRAAKVALPCVMVVCPSSALGHVHPCWCLAMGSCSVPGHCCIWFLCGICFPWCTVSQHLPPAALLGSTVWLFLYFTDSQNPRKHFRAWPIWVKLHQNTAGEWSCLFCTFGVSLQIVLWNVSKIDLESKIDRARKAKQYTPLEDDLKSS